MYRSGFSGQVVGPNVPLEEPAVVVTLDEGPDRRSGLLEGFEVVQVDALFLERHLADMDVCDMDIRRFAVDHLLEPDGATTQSVARASGTWSSAPSGCSEHWNSSAGS